MPLTATHEEARLLSDEQVEAIVAQGDFLQIMEMGHPLERAEVLDRLESDGRQVRMHTSGEDITFQMTRPGKNPTETHTIPGKGKPARAFPSRVAVFVASNLDVPLFGGGTWKQSKGPDGVLVIEPVAARPDLISFELVGAE